ncbi:OmpW/AlkL family protein [Aerolutibacter ruishenii]|uniref:Outer membrane protein n=1 Tax=Aerolutibacter ruishenii TaxID=686800 RepID=A0A562LRP4_9GAMM|nr:OmpW family outer membrane protein [Lysobacter ruishenii]TWI10272.1 outer membrane protein [Lysobacter ruishenii]
MNRNRTLTLALLGAVAIAPTAFAQDGIDTRSKRFAIVGGYALAEPTQDPTIAGTKAKVDGDGAATLSASYYITDNFAIEAWGAADKFGHRVNTAAGKTASVAAQPYALSGQYHFGSASQTVRPFVGLGYFESNFSEETATPTGPLAGQRIGVDTAKGAMATVGVDANFHPNWFARADVRYLHGKPDVAINGVDSGEAKLNPVVLGVGLGARF